MTKTTESKRRRDMAVGIVIGHIIMAVGIVIGHIIGDAINELNSNIANDESRWITTKKQSKAKAGQ